MTYRLSALAMLLVLGGCDFGFGSGTGTQERSPSTSSLTVASDGGTGSVNQQGCTFVPCDGPYGTNCGFVCPPQ